MQQEDIKLVVYETLTGLGFTVDDPYKMQQDMIYIRQFREGTQALKSNFIKVFLSVTIPGFLYLIWEAFKSSLNQ